MKLEEGAARVGFRVFKGLGYEGRGWVHTGNTRGLGFRVAVWSLWPAEAPPLLHCTPSCFGSPSLAAMSEPTLPLFFLALFLLVSPAGGTGCWRWIDLPRPSP